MLVGAPINQRVVLCLKTGDLEDQHQGLITTRQGHQLQEAQICHGGAGLAHLGNGDGTDEFSNWL